MASRETFEPGLFDIGLNITKKMSNQYLLVESKQLTYYVEIEPIYMKPTIRNMLAVLTFHMDLGRTKARLMLEELVKEYPNDLNILADLISVYKNMGRKKDSDRYKRQLALHKDDQLLRAKSILGQANALTYDLTGDYNTRGLNNMKDKHLQQVSKANNLIEESNKVVKTIPDPYKERRIEAKVIAVENFEKGINMLENLNCSKEEILVWKFNYAIARGRLDYWRKSADCSSCHEDCVKALEAYLDVIENLSPIEHLDEPLKKYVAKSNIFFAQLYCARGGSINLAQLSERITSQELDSMCYKAMSICPDDPMILQRCARYQCNKNKYLEAIDIYNRSISLLPDIDINWFSYASRRDAYFRYSINQRNRRSNNGQIDKYLKLAYNDAEVCIKSKCTIRCMQSMAEICFYRAMPDHESGVGFHCQHIDFIYEALETIQEMLNTHKEDSKTYSDLGRYYPYIGEYRKAVESLKTALELNEWNKKYKFPFLNLCKCFVALYERENDKNLLGEFRFMLKEAKKRGCDEWVGYGMKMVIKYTPEMLTDLVQNMIEWDVSGCERLIEEVLEFIYWNQPRYSRICRDLRKQFETKLQERNDQESDINGPTEIQKLQSTEKLQYDFFVSHSEKDKDWVNSMLRPRLELFDEEMEFKGFIPSRDFIPGDKVIDSIIKGIKQSRKLLIVLTPNYLEDNWQKIVSNAMILSAFESKVKEKTIIPIILEECEIPLKLKPFPPIIFTEKSDWVQLQRSLVVNMD